MLANVILLCVEAYAAIGAIVAIAFLAFGLDQIDPSARGAYAFRPLLAPGAILIWPFLLWRWRRLSAEKAG